jgi:hypothetical protein
MLESCWNVMAHGDAREGKWRGNWRMECVASTLHTASEHGVSSITTADTHTSAASSRLNCLPCRFKLTRPFRRKTKSGLCACAITFQKQSTCCVYISCPDILRRRHFCGLLCPEEFKTRCITIKKKIGISESIKKSVQLLKKPHCNKDSKVK